MRRKILLVLAAFLAVLPAWGLTVLQLNLEQLTALSEKIFAGRCLSVSEERGEGGRAVQVVTFEVTEMLKGEPMGRVTFRQLGFVEGGEGVGLSRDLPRYEVREEAVIFLSAESRLGLTAPVGLKQGKFKVEKGSTEEGKKVVNGLGNRGLFVGWKKSPKFKSMSLTSSERDLLRKEGALPYQDFLSLVKKLSTP